MKPPKSISFQEFFSRFHNVYSLQNTLQRVLNSDVSAPNLLLNIIKIPENLIHDKKSFSIFETIKYNNSLYSFQNNLELERSLAKKFTSNKPIKVELTDHNQFKNSLKLLKLKQSQIDSIAYNPNIGLNYLGLYYTARQNANFDIQISFFGMTDEERLGHSLISGNSDFGKNTTISNMIMQDIFKGNGTVLISSNNFMIESLIKDLPGYRLEDVIYLKPGDKKFSFGIDLFEGKDLDIAMETAIDIFKNIWKGEQSDKITYYLEPIMHLLLCNLDIANFSDYNSVIFDTEFRNKLLSKVTDRKILIFWKNITKLQITEMQSTLIKLETINRNRIIRSIIENEVKQIKISHILASKKILIVDLSNLAEDNTSARFIGNLILKKIVQLAPQSEIKDIFPVYIDEFWNYDGQDLFSKVSYLRKHKIALTFSQQGTFNKNLETDLGINTFGSFVNKFTFNTSDPYSKYNNHPLEFEVDALLKKLPNNVCMFEGFLQNQPVNPFLLEIIDQALLAINNQIPNSVSYLNQAQNFDFIKHRPIIEPVNSKQSTPKPKPILAAQTTQTISEKSSTAKPTQLDINVSPKKTLELEIKELENKLLFDASGNPRKTALNASRRKKINEKIKELETQIKKL